MKKRFLTLTTALVLSAAMTVPVFAASPSTQTVMNTPVSVPTAVVAQKGYTLTEAEQAMVATTPEQAVALAAGVNGEVGTKLEAGVLFGSLPAAPALIAMAKADLLKDAELQKLLQSQGVMGLMTKSGMLSFSNGKTGNFTVDLTAAGLLPGEKVVLLVYVPGELKPRVVRTVWKNGKIRAKLPIPCNYSILK